MEGIRFKSGGEHKHLFQNNPVWVRMSKYTINTDESPMLSSGLWKIGRSGFYILGKVFF